MLTKTVDQFLCQLVWCILMWQWMLALVVGCCLFDLNTLQFCQGWIWMERIQLQAVLSILFIMLCSVNPKADPKVYSNHKKKKKHVNISIFLSLRQDIHFPISFRQDSQRKNWSPWMTSSIMFIKPNIQLLAILLGEFWMRMAAPIWTSNLKISHISALRMSFEEHFCT